MSAAAAVSLANQEMSLLWLQQRAERCLRQYEQTG